MPKNNSNMQKKALIVSLHDVTPGTSNQVLQQVEELKKLGVDRLSFLVVPHYHGEERLDERETFVSRLREYQAKGCEMVLHGWSHQSGRSPLNVSKRWFYENLYTSGEAEFANLNYEEAHSRIEKGLTMFRKLGLNAKGFIPPAWLMNSEVEKAARDQRLLYTNTISEIVHLSNRQRYSARSCVWSTRALWRRMSSLAWNAALFQRLKSAQLLRISLHPCDLEYPAIWGQIRYLIQSSLRTHRAMTYADWVSAMVSL